MPTKPKIALYWCSSCGGCEESVIDLSEGLLDLSRKVDIVFWPVAMDVRYHEVESFGDGEIVASFINGAIRMEEQGRMARLLRQKSKLVVAHGSCAHLGGVVGLANFSTSQDLLKRAYRDVETVVNPSAELPGSPTAESGEDPPLSGLYDRVKALDQVIPVDYTIPGCPPSPEIMEKAIGQVLFGQLPPKGSVLADKKALCHTCPRLKSKPEEIRVKRFARLYEKVWDPDICFLAQGLICAGPATRGGCGVQCVNANMPCRGCFGPLDNVSDQGARILSLLAGLMDADTHDELAKISGTIPDPTGLFYRYCTATSTLGGGFGGRQP